MFSKDDLPLATKIQEVLQGGYIYSYLNKNAVKLIIKDNITFYKIIKLINGLMRTPKIEALHRMIVWLNDNQLNNNPLPLLGLDTSPLGSNGWLSGFLDADSNFDLNWKFDKKELPTALEYYMRISQKQEYDKKSKLGISYLPIMEKISQFFLTKVIFINPKKESKFIIMN